LQIQASEGPPKAHESQEKADSTIVYSTVGRSQYAFDIYTLPADTNPVEANAEVRLTDGQSVNFNGAFGRYSSTAATAFMHVYMLFQPIQLQY